MGEGLYIMGILYKDRMKRMVGDWMAMLMELFYPRVCEVCGKSLIQGEEFLCSFCLSDFPFADQSYIVGRELLEQFEPSCRPEQLFALYYYDKYSVYRNLIHLIKYHSYKDLGFYLGRMLGEKLKPYCEADVIIPIPLHRRREWERGFNQALEIAKGINEVLQVELLRDVVARVKNNVSQTGKNATERFGNVENVFELVTPELVTGRHVLLVDDVVTTGATIGSCLRVIAQAGDVRFSLACLAKTL